jgi:oligopeptidase A
MSGIQTLRQVEFAEFDLRIHLSEAPNDIGQVLKTLNSIRQETSVIDVPQYNRFPHSFSHIFAGGYAAGYYSYKWAEVLSADAFSMTEDGGMSLSDIGSMFLNEVIGKGGLRSSLKNFVKFRGREPKIDALLQHTGLTEI